MDAVDVPRDETSPLLADRSEQGHVKSLDGELDGWGSELWLLCQYSLPLIATYLLQYSSTVITTVVAGHVGSDDLAAASLGLTTVNIVGFALYEGMATALDTLCAQAYGAGHVAGVGLHVQRMALFMAVSFIPVGAIWLCSPWILPLFVKQPDLAAKAGVFLQINLIGLPGYAFFEAGKRFSQAQGDFKSGMLVLIISTPINALLSWLFAIRLGMGLEGAALGQALANDLRPVLLLLQIMIFEKDSHKAWGGFSSKAFSEWGPMVRLSLAGLAVNLAEWFAFEILTVSTSYIGTDYLAAQTIVTTISVISWHIPFSISVAVSTRVGHLIGAGLVATVRRAAILYAAVFAFVGICDGAFSFLLREQLISLITDDSAVRDIAMNVMLTVAVFQLLDSLNCGCNGVLRGLGYQSVAAWVIFPVNYLGAVPFAIWLELGPPDLKLNGAWMGLGAGVILIGVIECIYMKWVNWEDCVEDVRERQTEE